jgi:hypothetical protein
MIAEIRECLLPFSPPHCLLSKDLNIKIYKTVILSVVLHGSEMAVLEDLGVDGRKILKWILDN